MRRVLLATVALMVSAVTMAGPAGAKGGGNPLSRIEHLVVIYLENHSFDNLYGLWPGVDGLSSPTSATPNQTQVDASGSAYTCLKQNDAPLTSPPRAVTCADPRGFSSAFPNQL